MDQRLIDFCDGELYKECELYKQCELFSQDACALQIKLYYDEVDVCICI